MQHFELEAEPRGDVGKGASRRLRREGKLPGVVYGSKKDATSITLKHSDLVHQLDNEAFYSHILTLNIGKEKEQVILKDLQRHPYKPTILHIDFQRIDEKEKLTIRVPIHFINETRCIGVKQGGGVISHIMNEIEILCLPKDLPEFIEVDLENVNVGDAVHLADLKLPEGVECYAMLHGGDGDQPVATVHVPRVAEEEEQVAAEGEPEEAATPETETKLDEDSTDK
jgi:large subunit ribosomal protein L25